MAQPISQEQREKLVRLVTREGVTLRSAANACRMSHTSAQRVMSLVEQPSLPFSGGPQPSAVIPPPNWSSDQPRPPDARPTWDPRYHGHSFTSFSAPLSFDGWNLDRIRKSISMHRVGIFLESSTLAMVIVSLAPVLAALGQRMSPSLALPRHIRRGNRGLSRILGEEIERQLVPRLGLAGSEYFPQTLWGSMSFDLAMMGFSVLQHVDGEPDEETGIRPRYTRRWPTWATQYYRYRRTYVAITNEGPVDIVNDGKFTLVADSDEPHFFGAIVALGEESFDALCTKRARASYIDKYGNPKWVGTMPAGTAPNTPEGDAAALALETIRGPDGFGIMPNGFELDIKGLESGRSTVLKDALESNWMYVAATLLGSDGTMTRGTGVYSAPIFAGVRRDLVDRDLNAQIRAVNSGHIGPWLDFNYRATIESTAGWIQPALDIPLPDPDSDARIKSYADRVKAFHEAFQSEKANGFAITQERVNQLASSFEIDAPNLADIPDDLSRLNVSPDTVEKVARVREIREAQGWELLGDERDDMTVAELDALSKSKASAASEEAQGEPSAEGEPVEGAAVPQEGPAEDGQDRVDQLANVGSETKSGGMGKLDALSPAIRADYEPAHEPAGSSKGGQFAKKGGGGSGDEKSGKDEKSKDDESKGDTDKDDEKHNDDSDNKKVSKNEVVGHIEELDEYEEVDLSSKHADYSDREEIERQKQWGIDNFTQEEEGVIQEFAEGTTYEDIRQAERDGFKGPYAEEAKILHEAVVRGESESGPISLYRGMQLDPEEAQRLLDDDEFDLGATSSFSSIPDIALKYSRGWQSDIDDVHDESKVSVVLAGRLKGIAISSGYEEHLLSARKLNITERNYFDYGKHGKVLVVTVEEQ